MCGILGIVNYKSESDALINKMLHVQKHRGPDATGSWHDASCYLGHNRLAIIDLDTAANQPMISQNGRYVIAFNGEIYNYKSIRAELSKDVQNWRTNSDTEVLLEAFVRWGPECLKKLNGMFAFAVWDLETKELFIARDRMGIKPLYYALHNDLLVFASELRTILKSNLIAEEIDLQSVHNFLRFQWIQTPNTIIKGISTLPAGCYATFQNNKIDIVEYWSVDTSTNQSNQENNIQDVQKNVRDLFYSSVESRLVSDVPVGAFLSGGIDSSAVVAAMAHISTNTINTFSIGFNEKKYDESIFAEAIAKKYNTNHQTLTYSADRIKRDIPEILASFDTPSVDGVNSYVISKLVKDAGITVALSGLGGDELFCGYPVFNQIPKLKQHDWLWHLPKLLRSGTSQLLSILGHSKLDKLGRLLSSKSNQLSELYPYFREICSTDLTQTLLKNGAQTSVFEADLSGIQKTETLSWISVAEISGYTRHVLMKDADMCSMTHALEMRVPFFDHHLIEYVLGLPDHLKNPLTPKKLLTDSLNNEIPDDIVNRPKMGFSFPWDVWLKNDLKLFVEENLKQASKYPFLNGIALEESWKHYLNGKKTIKWYHIWNMVCLIVWMDENLT